MKSQTKKGEGAPARIDLNTITDLYNAMESFANSDNTDSNLQILCEKIKLMTEYQIWGEKNNDTFFDFFCENNVLELMLKILRKTKSKEVVVQIIQSLSLYLTNIDNPTNINYILSNNSINEFIMHDYNFNDEDVVDFYINFLKSMSQRLSTNPLLLFFNEKCINFPLLSQAVRLYNYREPLVRTSVQNIVFTVLKLKDEKIHRYVTEFPFVLYYAHFGSYLRDNWKRIDDILYLAKGKAANRIKDLLEDLTDTFYYIEDVFQMKIEDTNTGALSINLSMHLLYLLFMMLNYEPLLEGILLILLCPYIDSKIETLINEPLKPPTSYTHDWQFKNVWDTIEELMNNKNCSINDYHLESFRESTSFNDDAGLKARAEHLNDIYNVETLFDPKRSMVVSEEHANLSRGLGIVTERIVEKAKQTVNDAPLAILQRFKEKIEGEIDLSKVEGLIKNPFRDTFLSFLRSKDDNMIINHVAVLYAIFQNKILSQKIYLSCALACPSKVPGLQLDVYRKQVTIPIIQELLTNLLTSDIAFRMATINFLAKVLSFITNKEGTQLNYILMKAFSRGYKDIANRLKKLLQSEQFKFSVSEMADKLLKTAYEKEFQITEKRNYVYMLIHTAEMDSLPEIDLFLRNPQTKDEFFIKEFSIFLIYRKLRYILLPGTLPEFVSVEESLRNVMQKKDSADDSNNWEVGKAYNIVEKKLIPCTIEIANEPYSCYLVEDPENVVVIMSEFKNEEWARIHKNFKIKKTELSISNFDPKTLMIETPNPKERKVPISFDDENICQSVKKMLEHYRQNLIRLDHLAVVKFLESCIKDLPDAFAK